MKFTPINDAEDWKCTHKDYHADMKRRSHSQIELFRDDHEKFRDKIVRRVLKDSGGDAKDFGRGMHALVLETDPWSFDFETYKNQTLAAWTPIDQESPSVQDDLYRQVDRNPDFRSEDDSEYWHVTRGGSPVVVRRSPKWGDVNGCHWDLDTGKPSNGDLITAVCELTSFVPKGQKAFVPVPCDVLGKSGTTNTNDYRAWAKRFARDDRPLIKSSVWKHFPHIVTSIRNHKMARRGLYEIGQRHAIGDEYTITFTDPITGMLCRCRIDRLCYNERTGALIIIDLKTARTAIPRLWVNQAINLGYHRQVDFYIRGALSLFGGLALDAKVPDCWNYMKRPTGVVKSVEFYFAVVEKEPSYRCGMYELPYQMVELGGIDNDKDMRELQVCLDTGVYDEWRDADEIMEVPMPNWMKHRYENIMNDQKLAFHEID